MKLVLKKFWKAAYALLCVAIVCAGLCFAPLSLRFLLLSFMAVILVMMAIHKTPKWKGKRLFRAVEYGTHSTESGAD